jgi:hypothetical protein
LTAKLFVVLLSNVSPGTHPRLRHLGNGGVVIMSQAQKHSWIGAVKYWVYVIFAQLCAMFSTIDHICIIQAPNFRTELWIQKAGKQETETVLGCGGRASKIPNRHF